VIDNSSELAIDALVGGSIMTGTSPTVNKQIEVWAFGTFDGGTTFSAGAGATDANLTITSGEKTQLRLLTIIGPTTATSNQAYRWGPFSIQNAFGSMPKKWGIFVVHNTAVNLNSTGGNHIVKHDVIKYTSA
jgi:hypothetical protein